MFSLPPTGLRFRLMVLVALAMLPVSGLLLNHASEDRDQQLSDMQNDAVRVAELTAVNVGQIVEGTRQMLRTAAFTQEIRNLDGPASSALFAQLLDNSANIYNIGLVQSDGFVLASAVPLSGVTYLNERSWFSRLQKSGEFSIGDFQVGKIIKRPTVVLALPVAGQFENQQHVALYASLNLESLQRCVSKPRLNSASGVLVVDRDGTILARNVAPAKWIGQKFVLWPQLKEQFVRSKGMVEIPGMDGVNRLYCTEPVPNSDSGLFVIVGIGKDSMLTAIRANFLGNFIWLGIFTVMTLAGAWFFVEVSVLLQVRRLNKASQQLAQGNWDMELPLDSGSKELRQLARSFDEMAASLRLHRDRLEELVEHRTFELTRTNAFLTEEINERKQAEAVSAKLLANLERSNKELEQFAYVASHDLQEPLRLVSAYTQMLLQRYRDKLDADADPIVKFITEGVARMQRLIQDLLAYSRLSSQESTLSFADAEAPLETALRNLDMAIQEHHAVVTHDPLPALMCDPAQLAQLFQNLIGNAIKFRG